MSQLPRLLLLALLAPARGMLVLEKVKVLMDDIKASREWISKIHPVWSFMTAEEAKAAMAGEVDPAQLPEPVADLLAEISAVDPTIIHVSVFYDPAWSLDTIATLEAQMVHEAETKGVAWEHFVKPFMPYWSPYMGPWLCHIQTVSKRLSLDCPPPDKAPGTATRRRATEADDSAGGVGAWVASWF